MSPSLLRRLPLAVASLCALLLLPGTEMLHVLTWPASRPPLLLCFALSSPAQFHVHRFHFSDLRGNQVRKGNATS